MLAAAAMETNACSYASGYCDGMEASHADRRFLCRDTDQASIFLGVS